MASAVLWSGRVPTAGADRPSRFDADNRVGDVGDCQVIADRKNKSETLKFMFPDDRAKLTENYRMFTDSR